MLRAYHGQTVLEYVLLIGIVTLALVYMGTDLKRGLQSVVKVTADQMGNQVQSDQDFDMTTQKGFLLNSTSNTWQKQQTIKEEMFGDTRTQEGIFTESLTNSITNTGLSNG